jgi:subtilase family serine protease
LWFVLFLLLVPCAKAQTATGEALPYPTKETPAPVDRGALVAQPKAAPLSVTVALGLRDVDAAEALLRSLNTAGDPQYHKFLSADEFTARFAPTDAEVSKAIAGFAKYSLTAERATATTLTVTGSPAAIERAFNVTLHSYEVPAHGDTPAYTFHAPVGTGKIPAELAGAVSGIAGLDNRPAFHPHNLQGHPALAALHQATPAPSSNTGSTTGNIPGEWTVTDFANYYDVNPLYKKGITGAGTTLAIVTLASFTPSDAFAYWKAVGLKVNPYRIHVVNVDGGPGAPSDDSGSDETTLDVEQSGGIAPGAKIIVYQAPNTGQAFLDAFAAAIESNYADSISTSWGSWEWFYNLENTPVTDPTSGKTVSFAQALHELLLRAAIQGQTFYAASGDGGAYMVNYLEGCEPSTTPNSCSLALSVEIPASDTAMVAAGGTTLAGEQSYCLNSPCTPPYYVVNIPNERVWAWDYLIEFCKVIGYDPVSCGIFPVGSSGGVSIMNQVPWYQSYLPGVQRSQPHQYFVYDDVLYYALPAYYPGRNVPDISFNGDPDTGYQIYYTSSANGFEILTFWGGTSFVAPQLNGVTALFNQECYGRQGLLNYPLYAAAENGGGYYGRNPSFNSIPYGDNWFYRGSYGYNPAVGLGTLNVANFAHYLQEQK